MVIVFHNQYSFFLLWQWPDNFLEFTLPALREISVVLSEHIPYYFSEGDILSAPWQNIDNYSYILNSVCFFIYLLSFLKKVYLLLYFFHYHLSSLCFLPLLDPNNPHTVVRVQEFVFFCCLMLPPSNSTLPELSTCCLYLWVCLSVAWKFSSVCSLDSKYEWDQRVFVFLWMAYFT